MNESGDEERRRRDAFESGWSKAMSFPAPPSDGLPSGSFGDFAGQVGFELLWNRGVFTTRERRLVILTILACFGRDDITSLHLGSAIDLGDLDAEDLNELAVTIGAYAGLPRGVAFNSLAQKLLADRARVSDD